MTGKTSDQSSVHGTVSTRNHEASKTAEKLTAKRLLYLKILVCICLSATIVVCGYGSYILLYNLEGKAENSQFSSLASQFQTSAQKNVYSKISALQILTATLALQCPYSYTWPNCSIPMRNFLNISNPISDVSYLRAIAFAPIIKEDQVKQTEAYAFNFYKEQGFSSLGIQSFGEGIYARNSSGNIYHDVNATTLGKHKILTPVIQISELDSSSKAIMYNLYSEQYRINAIDLMIECFYNGSIAGCSTITDIIHLVQDPVFRPAVLIFHPVSPRYNTTDLVGLTYTVHNWDTIFSDSIPNFIVGIDAVLYSGTSYYTFSLNNGVASYLGAADMHDTKYDSRGEHFSFDYFSSSSVKYSISLYPTDKYNAQFHSNGPIIACIISVTIIVLTSLIFFLYDFLINRQALQNELIMNTKRLFVRFISHEIRTPMNTVHVGLKLLDAEMQMAMKSGQNKDEEMIKNLESWVQLVADIEESSDSAIVVLNDLINYDKISMGGLNVELRMMSFWSLITTTIKPFYVQAKQKNVALELDMEINRSQQALPPDRRQELCRLVMNIDDIKIIQVIRNMVSNAIKFTPEAGSVLVTVYWDDQGVKGDDHHCNDIVSPGEGADNRFPRAGSIVLLVKDSGAGMRLEDQKNLFKEGMQFQANKLQAGGGSGLGLWISKGVVNLHKGSLTAMSEGEGKGSTFRLELPAYRVPPTSDLVYKEPVGQEKAESSMSTTIMTQDVYAMHRPVNILIVEDATSTRKVLCRLLGHAGYNCLEAFDGQDCLDKLAQFAQENVVVDIILMDFEMPRLNGPKTSRIIRDQGISTPIIGLTGNVLQEDKNTFLDNGANDVLTKPTKIDELRKAIYLFCSRQSANSSPR